ncbi:MAG: tetrahydrofolate dehydrogenase/cyclohydrolase catalytic domain-containing protein [Verrucomicrobiota bacterium]
MPATLLDGKAIAQQIDSETRQSVELLAKKQITPQIVFIRVGEDPASRAYVGMKDKRAADLGIKTRTEVLDATTSEEDLLKLIESCNQDADVHGILVQAPLPTQINEATVFATVLPEKDVDGFNPTNVGKLLIGDTDGFRPCTPAGVQEILIRSGIDPSGKNVVILGRGNIVGKPMAAILCQKATGANATVTLLHSRSQNIPEHCRRADIIIAAMGQAEFVKADMVKPGATVIDVGVNRVDDPAAKRGYRLVGDIEFEAICEVAGHVTPNPGGVGPMTIAMLMHNTVRAAQLQNVSS